MNKNIQKLIFIFTLTSIFILLLGCSKIFNQNPNSSNIDSNDSTTVDLPQSLEESEDSTEYSTKEDDYKMSFVDVEGNKYETTILGTVPKHNYDFSYLKNDSNFYQYNDPNTGVSAKIGIDVSKYQGKIDWVKVKNSGIEFVIIRLGFRGYGKSGSLNLDEKFKEYIEGALNVGLDVGVYFFSQAITNEEAIEEAEFVLKNIKNYPITLPIIFDTEEIKDVPDARTAGISGEQFTNCCISFCDKIADAGYTPMIYFNMKWQVFTLDVIKLTKYQKWYADYEPIPQSPYEFSIWQYTEKGSVDGITGNVDLNLWFNK